MSRASLLSFDQPERSKKERCYIPLAISFMLLFSIGVGMLIKLLFDISQEISAIRQNTFIMCEVLPMKSDTCVGQ